MAVIKCKMCGGDLALSQDSSIAVCEYCGTQQTVPIIQDDKKARLYNRANQYRLDNEFDKAYAAYESIANDQPDEAEAYWGMTLCEYGVAYVDDPKTGKKIPTCHRTLTRSITSSVNYKAACQHADADSRILYEDEAVVLDNLQKRVLNASAKEEPYDVFICYKETDESGNRTADSVIAQDIYDALTNKGLRVFFSRISLEDKLGQDYEPCIFAALNSAKVMLMVTANSDHCNAVWVKNEWKRYLDFMRSDPSKTLIPVYKDISPYTLPDAFSHLQAQDMGKLGAIQDLVRGVEKLTGRNQKAAPAGMTQQEKSMVDAMRESQKKTRALLLAILCGAAFMALSMVALLDYSFWDILAYDERGRDITWTGDARVLVIMFYYAVMGIGIGVNITYGMRSRVAHWVYLLGTVWATVRIFCVTVSGHTPAESLFVYPVIYGVAALLSAFFAYRKSKTAFIIHLIVIILAVLAAVYGSVIGV